MEILKIDKEGQDAFAYLPDVDDVESLAPGAMAVDPFGTRQRWIPVERVVYRGTDINGKAYVGFYVRNPGENGACSHSYKAGEIVAPFQLMKLLNSDELRSLQKACDERTAHGNGESFPVCPGVRAVVLPGPCAA